MADAPPKKKLPFKQRKKYTAPAPTPGDNSKGDNNDELDLFSRRKEMQPILEADRRRRIEKEKRKAEAAAKEKQIEEERLRRWKSYEKKPLEDDDDQEFFDAKERQAPTGDVEGATTNDLVAPETESFNRPMTPPSSKRKRGESGSAGSRKHPTPSTNAQESKSRSLRNSAMSTPSKDPTKATAEYAVISIDSDDDGNTNTKPAQRADSIEVVDENHITDEDEEDDEFAELIRAAEEEKKRLAEQTEGASAGVLLTSEIEGTKPASLKIKLDQHLVKALDAWVTTQLYKHNVQLPCPAADLVISWRREKVYHYSTLLGLGVRTEGGSSTGAITGVSRKGLSEDRSKVHLEISTPEIFQRWEEERRKEAAPPEASDDELAPVVEEEKLRVILRARDLEDVKLTVRPATTAKTLVEAYKRIRGLEGKNITLWFDGDQLSGESTLEQMDIDDLDTVEVHIN